MNYNEHQLTIIRRMGEISARLRDSAEARKISQMEEAHHLVDVITSLRNAIAYSDETTRLFVEHSDAFREFLDSL